MTIELTLNIITLFCPILIIKALFIYLKKEFLRFLIENLIYLLIITLSILNLKLNNVPFIYLIFLDWKEIALTIFLGLISSFTFFYLEMYFYLKKYKSNFKKVNFTFNNSKTHKINLILTGFFEEIIYSLLLFSIFFYIGMHILLISILICLGYSLNHLFLYRNIFQFFWKCIFSFIVVISTFLFQSIYFAITFHIIYNSLFIFSKSLKINRNHAR